MKMIGYTRLTLLDLHFFFFQAEDGIRDFCLSRGLGVISYRTIDAESAKTLDYIQGES
ncbi:hypothetical protein [Streptococcus suis]